MANFENQDNISDAYSSSRLSGLGKIVTAAALVGAGAAGCNSAGEVVEKQVRRDEGMLIDNTSYHADKTNGRTSVPATQVVRRFDADNDGNVKLSDLEGKTITFIDNFDKMPKDQQARLVDSTADSLVANYKASTDRERQDNLADKLDTLIGFAHRNSNRLNEQKGAGKLKEQYSTLKKALEENVREMYANDLSKAEKAGDIVKVNGRYSCRGWEAFVAREGTAITKEGQTVVLRLDKDDDVYARVARPKDFDTYGLEKDKRTGVSTWEDALQKVFAGKLGYKLDNGMEVRLVYARDENDSQLANLANKDQSTSTYLALFDRKGNLVNGSLVRAGASRGQFGADAAPNLDEMVAEAKKKIAEQMSGYLEAMSLSLRGYEKADADNFGKYAALDKKASSLEKDAEKLKGEYDAAVTNTGTIRTALEDDEKYKAAKADLGEKLTAKDAPEIQPTTEEQIAQWQREYDLGRNTLDANTGIGGLLLPGFNQATEAKANLNKLQEKINAAEALQASYKTAVAQYDAQAQVVAGLEAELKATEGSEAGLRDSYDAAQKFFVEAQTARETAKTVLGNKFAALETAKINGRRYDELKRDLENYLKEDNVHNKGANPRAAQKQLAGLMSDYLDPSSEAYKALAEELIKNVGSRDVYVVLGADVNYGKNDRNMSVGGNADQPVRLEDVRDAFMDTPKGRKLFVQALKGMFTAEEDHYMPNTNGLDPEIAAGVKNAFYGRNVHIEGSEVPKALLTRPENTVLNKHAQDSNVQFYMRLVEGR